MPDDTQLDDLLLKWDELRRRGADPSAEELTADFPELTEQLRMRIEAIKAMDWLDSHDGGGEDRTDLTGLVSGERSLELPNTDLSSDEFLQNLSDTELMSADEISGWVANHLQSVQQGDARALAKYLIDEGRLTPYQAAVLLRGEKEKLLIDKYLILDSLDAGGMGVVFKAIHRPMNRVVALKMLSPHLLNSPDKVQRFRREVQVAASLTHPNIVTAFDADESKGVHFLVMEHVQGKDLKKVVDSSGPLTVDQAVDCLTQAACGLAHAHKKGVIHRDIKPSNLMLSADGVVKVLDLGLARMDEGLQLVEQELSTHLTELDSDQTPADTQEHLTHAGALMGTVAFMAPEQALDTHSVDHRADIYSLGCTLYYLLVGEVPYRGENPMQTVIGHREGPIPSLRRFRPDVPEELDAICRRMLAKKPEDRPQSMQEVISELEGLEAGATPSRYRSRAVPAARDSTGGDPDLTTVLDHDEVRKSAIYRRLLGLTAAICCVSLVWTVANRMGPNSPPVMQPDPIASATRNAEEQSHEQLGLPDNPAILALLGQSDEWEWSEPENLGPQVNSPADEKCPTLSADGRTLVFVSNRDGSEDLWIATRDSIGENFGVPVNMGAPINTPSAETEPSLSADGRFLVVTSFRNEGAGTADIWMCERDSATESFGPPINLGSGINSSVVEGGAELSADGLTLLFHSSRQGTEGWMDLWMSRRATVDDVFQEPVCLGAPVCNEAAEGHPSLALDGRTLFFTRRERGSNLNDHVLWMSTRPSMTAPFGVPVRLDAVQQRFEIEKFVELNRDVLYFSSQRKGGFGGADLWISRLVKKHSPTDDPAILALLGLSNEWEWSEPENLGNTVNSPGMEHVHWLSPDGRRLVFASDRPGGAGSVDLWETTREADSDQWAPPTNMGTRINSGHVDWCPALSADGAVLIFASNRPGSHGHDLWMSTRASSTEAWSVPSTWGAQSTARWMMRCRRFPTMV